ncbi:30S ribosomal protein S5 [Candidatus Parcubacteria bacterium]|nr:30S ribosomal protein S5 [Patescibacteria group bacterium]MBU4309513.1 30S ribosomal protein S5 [Patescibacteria group bacterium]MBU4432055.1 30S ribosomal protein S5 [Patescibacteria group bacterium]MBU4577219.1 30S ribosomal protein S5 [Patescibacteria group bacterium]MCG2696865.1 30S ribosomal protein S5 [Candidatus Parcubacteria bacterium]
MSNDKVENKIEAKIDTDKKAADVVAKSVFGDKKKNQFSKKRRPDSRGERPKEEFEQRIVDLARVTRVMAGGKRMRFRACVAIGDKNGRIGIGLDKGADVTIAISKAVNQAKKVMIEVPIVNDTIPHDVYMKTGAAKILLKPAKQGKGIIAGGAARIIFDLAGIKNISSKILGTTNKVSIARNVIEALSSLRKVDKKVVVKKEEGVSVEKAEAEVKVEKKEAVKAEKPATKKVAAKTKEKKEIKK